MAGEEPGSGAGAGTMVTYSGQNACSAAGADNTAVHWSRHLKCQVCFGYLRQPHTLGCGHSFCRICLVRLGQTSRNASPDVSLRYLSLPCPTCRALFPASSILRAHASTSFLIHNLVSDWRKERKRMKSSSVITLRSICTQTANRTNRLRRRKSPNVADLDMHEQFHKRLRLDDLYYRSMTANSSDSSEDMDVKTAPPMEMHPDPSINASETSTVSSVSSGPGYVFGRRFQEFGQHMGTGPRPDWSPGRVLLMSVWCVYSMVVVGIAQPMLPYMVLITLFFLVLILSEGARGTGVADCDSTESETDCTDNANNTCARVRNVKNYKQPVVEPGNIASQIMECLQKNAKIMDELHDKLKDCATCVSSIDEDGKNYRDVS
ncbi:hypothetical protein ACOMHN_048457 [Nucella lapillus]